MADAGRAIVQFQGDYSQLTSGLASALAPAKLGKMGKAGGLAIGAALAAAVGGAAVTKALYDLGKQFDDAYDKIRVGTGKTGKQLQGLEKDFKKVYSTVPAGMDDVATAISGLNQRLGLTGKPLQKLTRQVVELSRITDTDLESNVRGISRAFVDWEVPVKKQTKTLDGFYRLSQKSGAAVADLTSDVQKFGSPLRTLGFGIEDAASMFAVFEKAGVNAQTMVPGFKLAIGNLVKPTADLKETLEGLGVAVGNPKKGLRQVMGLLGSNSNLKSIEKISLAMDVFGKRAGADMAEAIKQGRFNLAAYIKEFESGNDAIMKSAKSTNDAGENLTIFWHKLQVALEPYSEAVYKAVGDISEALATMDMGPFLDVLAKLDMGIKKLVLPLEPLKKVFDLFGGSGDEVSSIKQMMQARLASVESLKKASERTVHARKRVTKATDAEREAERNLRNARKRFGAGSNEAVRAEIALQRAKQKTIRVTERAKKAERLEGIERQIASKRLRDQAVAEKARLGQLNRMIRVLNHRRNIEWKTNGDTQKLRDIEGKLTDKLKARSNTQKRLNNVLGDAANTIGPKFARSLKSISARTAAMETALGHIPGKAGNMREALGKISPVAKRLEPVIKDVGDTSKKSMDKAGDAMSDYAKVTGDKRVTVNRNMKLMPVVQVAATDRMLEDFSEKMGVFKNDGKPQSKRRGGLIQRFRKGGVPVAVSPGEMYKTPDGKAGIVPGRPEPRDSVLTSMPVGTKIFTFDGQRQLAEGASEASALRSQRPHFAGGGIVKPTVTGGSPKARDLANTGIDSLHGLAGERLKKAKASVRIGGTGTYKGSPAVKALLDEAIGIGAAHGSGVSSFLRPGTGGSYHDPAYNPPHQAVDLAGGDMMATAKGILKRFGPSRILELFYNPLGYQVDNYATGPMTVMDHYDHVHVAFRKGGIIGAIQNFMRGGTAEHRVVKNVGADLLKHGFDFRATAGILGNAWREGLWNPKQREFADSSNGGLYGFTTSPVSLPDMISWAESSGKNPWDEVVQTHFMLTHGQPTGFAIKGALNSEDTIAGAAEYFMRNWERPNLSVAGLDERIGAGHDASKILRDAGITKPGDSTDGGGGKSKPDLSKSRKKKRRSILDKLTEQVSSAKTTKGKQGALWHLIKSWAKYGDFDRDGATHLTDIAKRAAGTVNPLGNISTLKNLASWLDYNVAVSGDEDTNDRLVKRLERVTEKTGKRAEKKRTKITNRIAGKGTDYPLKGVLKSNDGIAASFAEQIDIAEQNASASFGPGGSDYTDAEVMGLVDKYRGQLAIQRDSKNKVLRSISYVTNVRDHFANLIKSTKPGTKAGWKLPAYRKGLTGAKAALVDLTGRKEGLIGVTGKGGDIFSTELQLKELGVMPTLESSAASERDTELLSLMREQLGLANRNNAILSAQTPIYEQFLPKYHTGGIIPPGGEQPIMAKGGEGVFTPRQMEAMGGGSPTVVIEIAEGAGVDPAMIDARINGQLVNAVRKTRTGGPAAGRKYVTNG